MNEAFEFHDSQWSAISHHGDTCVIELEPAYLHVSDGVPGVSPGKGYRQGMRIHIGGAAGFTEPCTLPLELDDGSLWLTGTIHRGLVPAFFTFSGAITLTLRPKFGPKEVSLSGTSVLIESVGSRVYVEEFPGSNAKRA